jgi:geranylgeranyl diphosphate synthase, type II
MRKAMPEFADFATTNKLKVDRQLQAALGQRAQIPGLAAHNELLKHIRALVGRGGKRVRPLLCLLAYQAYGGKNQRAIIKAAAAQELLHCFLLIHDDIIDRDYTRWGGKNILGFYFEKLSRTNTPAEALHQAEARAILAGDMCASLATELLLSADFSDGHIRQAAILQQQITRQVLAGELVDTAFPLQKNLPTESQVLDMYSYKTASYSFVLPLLIGAILAGADKAEQKVIAVFAQNLGVAYQLQDDLLGVFGSEKQTGKPRYGDLREGKRTVLVLQTLARLPAGERALFAQLINSKQLTEEACQTACQYMVSSGAKDYVTDLVNDYLQRSLTALKQATLKEAQRLILQDFVDQLTNRKR